MRRAHQGRVARTRACALWHDDEHETSADTPVYDKRRRIVHPDERGFVARHATDHDGHPLDRAATTDPLDPTIQTACDGTSRRVSVTYCHDAGALTGIDCPGGAYVVRNHFQGFKPGPFGPAQEDEAMDQGGAGGGPGH